MADGGRSKVRYGQGWCKHRCKPQTHINADPRKRRVEKTSTSRSQHSPVTSHRGETGMQSRHAAPCVFWEMYAVQGFRLVTFGTVGEYTKGLLFFLSLDGRSDFYFLPASLPQPFIFVRFQYIGFRRFYECHSSYDTSTMTTHRFFNERYRNRAK